MFDLTPATRQLSELVAGTRDDQLANPTPCTEWTVADLLAHVHQFASVFTTNAAKQPPNPPHHLVDDWRAAIPRQLDQLAAAWADEAAWQGRTSAGGIEMAAADNALVAVEELTVHGWDLAVATGQPFGVGDVEVAHVERFIATFDQNPEPGTGPFGPVGPAPASADGWQLALSRLGRNPLWNTDSA
ncbi:TIGR03086 family metal-binding protein [Nakamurella aerolata]|uniref:TIGR03086 family protein n=1 Tax=Nakamurella aerolata TaxID=1656892 RepID=A0A849AAN2_9ACTN|nr:TIGR03086 family metal-binding protein [Nakamurella aerolata]NNG35540.1 TIGR03086 family protein [Nakamurella aerolata]